ncbi:hypothetical protein AAVH_35952 [Aphelenchoides avenae]|nr:hypothetical protein AAVH_35952 [Aphelenchus avenae]
MSGISTHDSTVKKAEKRFAFQCLLINATLIVEYLTFHFVPFIPPLGQWNYLINFAVNLICVFNNMISPLILFTLNDEIRRVAAKIIRGG